MTFGKILKILDMVKWLFLCQRLSVNGEISETETSVETSETTKAEVSTEGKCTIYYETADSDFKSRYKNHNMFFRHKNHLNNIELSKYF